MLEDVVDDLAVALERSLVVDHLTVGDVVLLEASGEDSPHAAGCAGFGDRTEALDCPLGLFYA